MMINNKHKSRIGLCRLKYAYIKNGDAVEQIMRILPLQKKIPSSGPDAFISDFLKSIGEMPIYILSCGTTNAKYKIKNIAAIVMKYTYESQSSFSKVLFTISVFVRLFTELLKYKPDRILCGKHGVMLWSSFIYSKLFRVPFVFSYHNPMRKTDIRSMAFLINRFNRHCIKRTTSAICHGPYLKAELIDLGIKKNKVYNFDIGFNDYLRGKLQNESLFRSTKTLSSTMNLVYLGRIEKDKGVFDLFDAFTQIKPLFKDLKMMFIGDGSDLNSIRIKAQQNNVKGDVIFVGKVKHDDVYRYLNNATIVVTPTKQIGGEGRCMAAMESIFMGIPVIAPNFGPFPFLIQNGDNGILYEPDSVISLKNSIIKVLSDEKLYAKLCLNAFDCGKNLVNPKTTFSEAIELSFSK